MNAIIVFAKHAKINLRAANFIHANIVTAVIAIIAGIAFSATNAGFGLAKTVLLEMDAIPAIEFIADAVVQIGMTAESATSVMRIIVVIIVRTCTLLSNVHLPTTTCDKDVNKRRSLVMIKILL